MMSFTIFRKDDKEGIEEFRRLRHIRIHKSDYGILDNVIDQILSGQDITGLTEEQKVTASKIDSTITEAIKQEEGTDGN